MNDFKKPTNYMSSGSQAMPWQSMMPDVLAGMPDWGSSMSKTQAPWGEGPKGFQSLMPADDYTSLGSGWGQQAPTPWSEGFGTPNAQFSGPGINSPLSGATGGVNGWLQDKGVTGPNGWGNLALGAAQGLMGGYLGMQQLGLAKDQLATQKEQWGKNFGAQQKTTNERLATRQARRNKENSSSMPAGEYMAKYGI